MNEKSEQEFGGAIDAEKMSGLSRHYLRKLIYAGVLPSFTVGRRRLVRFSDVRAFIESKAAGDGLPPRNLRTTSDVETAQVAKSRI